MRSRGCCLLAWRSLCCIERVGGAAPAAARGSLIFSLPAWKQLCVQSPFSDSGSGVPCCQALCALSPFSGPGCASTAAWLWIPVHLCWDSCCLAVPQTGHRALPTGRSLLLLCSGL